MTALVRVKRCLDEEPLEAVVLNCKKRKINDIENKTQKVSAVLQFAGTLQEEESIHTLLKKHDIADLKELKEQFKKHPVNLNDKIRAQVQENSKNNRYKVVSCLRSHSLNLSEVKEEAEVLDKSSDKPEFTIFTIETDLNENDALTKDKNSISENKYVYDYYYTNSDDFGEADIEDYVSVYPLTDPLVFGSAKENGLDNLESDYDSEDSNAENNWRNDYPNESDLESINEDDMIEAMKKVNLGEDLLSSDDEDAEGFVYSIDEEESFDKDVDENDVNKYGKMYAKFKAKNKNIDSSSLQNDLYYGDIDEEEYYY